MKSRIDIKADSIKLDTVLIGLHFCTLLGHRLNRILEYTPIVFMLLYMFYYILGVEKGKFRLKSISRKYYTIMLVFSGYAFLSYFWCFSRSAYLELVPSMLESLILTLWILYFGNTSSRIINYLKAFVIATTYMCIRIIIYAIVVTGIKYGMTDTVTRPSTGWQFNMACQIAAFGAIIAFYFFRNEKKKLYLVPIVCVFAVELLAGSRKGLLMPIVGFFLLYLLEIDRKHMMKVFKLITYVIIVLIISFFVLRQNEALYNRMLGLALGLLQGTSTDGSFTVRMFLIDKAKYLFYYKPIWGWGMNAFGVYNYGNFHVDVYGRYAHNNYWELLSCLGIVGLILYYAKYVLVLIKAYKIHGQYRIANLTLSIFLVSIIFEYGIVSYYIIPLQIILSLATTLLVCRDQNMQQRY
ncbi:MAG: O-antigen ligase family protein [Coprococcus sp.]|nr:O-antigen ligase family protein [Coprococcus sp.]